MTNYKLTRVDILFLLTMGGGLLGSCDESTPTDSTKNDKPGDKKENPEKPDGPGSPNENPPKESDKKLEFKANVDDFIKKYSAIKNDDPNNYVANFKKLITQNTPEQKVRMIDYLIGQIVTYSHEMDGESDWEKILKSGKAVCMGFANLFKHFANECGLECEVISGYARGVGFNINNEEMSSNHAWVKVKVNNEWKLCDPTWDEGADINGKHVKKYNTDWLFVKPEHMIYSHYPDNSGDQFLSTPKTQPQFLKLPCLKAGFFNHVDKCPDNLQKVNIVKSGERFKFTYKTQEDKKYLVVINDGRQGINIIGDDGNVTCYVPTNQGNHICTIYSNECTTSGGMVQYNYDLGSFCINAQGDMNDYVTINAPNVLLVTPSPIQKALKAGTKYTFKVKVSTPLDLYIYFKSGNAGLSSDKIQQMTKDNHDNIYSVSITIPSGCDKAIIGKKENNSYQSYLTWDITS